MDFTFESCESISKAADALDELKTLIHIYGESDELLEEINDIMLQLDSISVAMIRKIGAQKHSSFQRQITISLKRILAILNVDRAFLQIFKNDTIQVLHCENENISLINMDFLPVATMAHSMKETIFSGDLTSDIRFCRLGRFTNQRAELATPVWGQSETITGVLGVHGEMPRHWNNREISFLEGISQEVLSPLLGGPLSAN